MPLGCFDIEMILKQFKRVFHKIQRLHYVQDDGAGCNEVLEIVFWKKKNQQQQHQQKLLTICMYSSGFKFYFRLYFSFIVL